MDFVSGTPSRGGAPLTPYRAACVVRPYARGTEEDTRATWEDSSPVFARVWPLWAVPEGDASAVAHPAHHRGEGRVSARSI